MGFVTPSPDGSELVDVCPQCGAANLLSRQCKLMCPSCGYVESCEDLFPTSHYANPAADGGSSGGNPATGPAAGDPQPH